MDNWTREQTKTLITLLRQYPCLYNPNDPDYTSKAKRNYKYHTIMIRLKSIKDNVTVPSIKKKIRTLQSQMCKEKVRVLRHNNSGLDESTYEPILWCYNDLLFLINNSTVNPSSSSGERPAIEKQPKKMEVRRGNALNARMLSVKLQKEASEALAMVKKLTQNVENQGREQVFCTYLCSELKAITSDDAFEDLKMEILQLVHNAIKKQKATLNGKPHIEEHLRSPYTMMESEQASDDSQHSLDNDSFAGFRGRAETPHSSLSLPSPVISESFTGNNFVDPLDFDTEVTNVSTQKTTPKARVIRPRRK